MFQIDLKSRKPIYEQVMDNFKRLVVTGTLKADEKVPSVRDMAKTLMVNPNTVQKAYRELESQGFFYTVPGQGNFIATPQDGSNVKTVKILYTQLIAATQSLLFYGESETAIINAVRAECESNGPESRKGDGND